MNDINNKNIWFTSDFHFSHNKDFVYGKRGFSNYKEMNTQLIKNYNNLVKTDDDVYILGDCIMGDQFEAIECMRLLNGHKYIILGNHDTHAKVELYKQLPNTKVLGYATVIKYHKWHFYLSHYPTKIGDFVDNKRNLCLCGHIHTTNPLIDIVDSCYHVELDAHNNKPVKVDKIISEVKRLREVAYI